MLRLRYSHFENEVEVKKKTQKRLIMMESLSTLLRVGTIESCAVRTYSIRVIKPYLSESAFVIQCSPEAGAESKVKM